MKTYFTDLYEDEISGILSLYPDCTIVSESFTYYKARTANEDGIPYANNDLYLCIDELQNRVYINRSALIDKLAHNTFFVIERREQK